MTKPTRAIEPLRLLLSWGTLAIGIHIASSTVIMVIATWDPAPFWDQWQELVSVRDVSWSWLISQHNEHRILLPRLVFIADRWLFAETNVLDFALNVLAQGSLTLLVVVLAKRKKLYNLTWVLWIAGLSASFLFWAIQSENFVWGFQVAFFLVLLLATCAFAVMALSPPTPWALGGVLILEATVVYTNANGIIAPFLIIPLAMLLGRPRSHILILCVSAVGLLGTYLAGYHTPSYHSDPMDAWRHVGLIVFYVLTLLGAPFGTALSAIVGANKVIAAVGLGSLATVSLVFIGWHLIRRRGAPSDLVLLTVACFVLGTALMTGMGRAEAFGIEQAFSSRYHTAALLFWLCLILVAANRVYSDKEWRLVVIMVSTLPILLVIAITQSIFVRSAESWANGRHIAVPALLSGVRDPGLLDNIYWEEKQVLELRELLKKAHTSIFTDEWGFWLGTQIEHHLMPVDADRCQGGFDSVEEIGVATSPRGWRAFGHALDLSLRKPVQKILLVGGDGEVVGFGVNDREPDTIGRNAWIGDFVADDPAPVRAYAIVDNDHSACPLGLPKQLKHLPQVELSSVGSPLPSPGGYVDSIKIGSRTVIVGWGMLSPVRSTQRIEIETNLHVSSAEISIVPRPDVVHALKDDGLADSGIKVTLQLDAREKIPAQIILCVATTDPQYGSHTLQIPSHPELCPAIGAP